VVPVVRRLVVASVGVVAATAVVVIVGTSAPQEVDVMYSLQNIYAKILEKFLDF
jgi:hypothetical protein